MESEERKALYHLVLSTMGQLVDRDEFDAWVGGEIQLAPLFEPVLESVRGRRDALIRELHQMFPAEVVDRFIAERPDFELGDRTQVMVRVGKELEDMKAIVQSM